MTETYDLEPTVVEGFVAGSGAAFERLVAVMAKLRSPTGCPWDREQTHESLARHLLEETYEVLEAIDAGDLEGLREELGDLILQVVFHSEIAFEEGAFTVADVADGLREKLIRRHPHVFGDVRVEHADEVLGLWEKQKRAEKGTGVMHGIPAAMPSLARAAKMSRRAAQVGFEWESEDDAVRDVTEEWDEFRSELAAPERDQSRVEAELGDVLFATASLARRLGIEPESALRKAADRFRRRWEVMEGALRAEGRDLESVTPEEWLDRWTTAKLHPDTQEPRGD